MDKWTPGCMCTLYAHSGRIEKTDDCPIHGSRNPAMSDLTPALLATLREMLDGCDAVERNGTAFMFGLKPYHRAALAAAIAQAEAQDNTPMRVNMEWNERWNEQQTALQAAIRKIEALRFKLSLRGDDQTGPHWVKVVDLDAVLAILRDVQDT